MEGQNQNFPNLYKISSNFSISIETHPELKLNPQPKPSTPSPNLLKPISKPKPFKVLPLSNPTQNPSTPLPPSNQSIAESSSSFLSKPSSPTRPIKQLENEEIKNIKQN